MKSGKIIAFILVALLALALAGVGWLIVCGITKLFTMCIGVAFSWKIGTAVWLVCLFVGVFFGRTSGEK